MYKGDKMSKDSYKFEILKKDLYHFYYKDRDDNAGGAIVYKNLKNNEFFEQSGKIRSLKEFYNNCEVIVRDFWYLLPFGKNLNDKNQLIMITDIKALQADLNNTTSLDEFKLEAQHAAMQQIADLNTAKIINTEKEQKNNEERQALIAEASRLTGRVEAFNFISNLATVSQLMIIKNIKESGVYKELPNINTWEEYCNSLGFSKRHIDEKLENLNTLGANFLETVSQFGLGYRELRQLKKEVKTGSLEVHDAEVIIDGETISLSETDALKDALTDLILKNQEEKKQHKAELKAKDKTIQTYADAAELAKEEEKKAKALADKYKDDIAHFFSGRISKVAENDRSDFQDIVNLEKDFEQLNIGLSNLLKKDYSEFNANMFCSLLGKMIIAIDSARIQASSKYNLFNFEAGILSNEEKRELEQGMTPLEFLK